MPRARLRREPCDCLDCREPAGAAALPSGSAAVARQDPPPKSLVVCLTGALQPAATPQEAGLPHLDALVAAGWAGLLACRAGGPPLPHQLLGLAREGASPAQSLPDRCARLLTCCSLGLVSHALCSPQTLPLASHLATQLRPCLPHLPPGSTSCGRCC